MQQPSWIKQKCFFVPLLLILNCFVQNKGIAQSQASDYKNIIKLSPLTIFFGGTGGGLTYERSVIKNDRLRVLGSVAFGIRNYYVTIQEPALRRRNQIDQNYSFLMRGGVKYYVSRKTSKIVYGVGTTAFLSIGSENGLRKKLDELGVFKYYEYIQANESRWGGMVNQYFNINITHRLNVEFEAGLGIIHGLKAKDNKGNAQPVDKVLDGMGLIGFSIGYRI